MVYFIGEFSQLDENKIQGAKGTKGLFWKQWAKVVTLWRGKKSKVTRFKERFPTSCQIIGGILIFSTSLLNSSQIWLNPLMHDHQPTYFTNLKKQKLMRRLLITLYSNYCTIGNISTKDLTLNMHSKCWSKFSKNHSM